MRERLSRDFYAIGVALAELAQPALYGAIGYDSFKELLEKRKVMSRTQASRLIEVVHAFEREQALALGMEKAYALIRYAAHTPADDVAAALAAANVRIGTKTVRTVTLRDLHAATRKIAARRASVDPELRAARREAREAQRKARAQGAAGAVVTARKQGGRTWLRIEVPADEAAVLLGATRRRGRGGLGRLRGDAPRNEGAHPKRAGDSRRNRASARYPLTGRLGGARHGTQSEGAPRGDTP